MNIHGGIRMSVKRGNNGDELTVLIDKMVKDLSCTPSRAIPSIHRVRDSLRSINEKAYDPTTVAIGPIHRNEAHLKKMDHQKKKYLKLLLDSMGESSVDRYVREIRYLEERARGCYADDMLIGLGKDDFALMLLLDGIFILEFFRSDIDWAGDVDDRKSTTGCVFFFGETAFTWISKKQPIVTLSICEAKYVAATSSVCHALWLRNLLKELGFNQVESTDIYVDNKSAITLAKNPVFHDRSKHIETRFHS